MDSQLYGLLQYIEMASESPLKINKIIEVDNGLIVQTPGGTKFKTIESKHVVVSEIENAPEVSKGIN
jgi:soluble P-type ATPase